MKSRGGRSQRREEDYSYHPTPHYIRQLWVSWPLQPLQTAQLQAPFGPSVDSLCHPCITTSHLSYRFPIFETSATALCSATDVYVYIYIYMYIHMYIYIYIHMCVSVNTCNFFCLGVLNCHVQFFWLSGQRRCWMWWCTSRNPGTKCVDTETE